MSKKLLSEAQVRRFQSLASIKPLQEMGHYAEENNESLYQEEAAEEEIPAEDELGAEEPAADFPPAEEAPELEAAEGDEVDMTSDDLSAVADALGTLQDKLAPLLDAVDAPADDLDADVAADPIADLGGEEEAEAEFGAEEPAEDDEVLEEALKGINYQPSQKEIVKTVALRVARRLQEAKNAQAKLDKALGKK